MKAIWKFPVPVEDEIAVGIPAGAEILCVQVEITPVGPAAPYVWALVETTAPDELRRFAWRGTGHDASGLAGARYVGTVQLLGGALVFHLFDRGPA